MNHENILQQKFSDIQYTCMKNLHAQYIYRHSRLTALPLHGSHNILHEQALGIVSPKFGIGCKPTKPSRTCVDLKLTIRIHDF